MCKELSQRGLSKKEAKLLRMVDLSSEDKAIFEEKILENPPTVGSSLIQTIIPYAIRFLVVLMVMVLFMAYKEPGSNFAKLKNPAIILTWLYYLVDFSIFGRDFVSSIFAKVKIDYDSLAFFRVGKWYVISFNVAVSIFHIFIMAMLGYVFGALVLLLLYGCARLFYYLAKEIKKTKVNSTLEKIKKERKN